tara:strand:+ start:637 stop:852 length:216 start_codon:yes stop_codon:yes gene_type:complete
VGIVAVNKSKSTASSKVIKYLSHGVTGIFSFLLILPQILVTEELVSNTLTNLATLPPLFKIILSQINLEAP